MSYPTLTRSATRALLIIALLQGITVACDPTSAVDSDGLKVGNASFAAVLSGVTATPASWSEIDLSWPRSPSANGYEVSRSNTGVDGSYWVVANTPEAVMTYADVGLSGSTQYCYRIRSTKRAGWKTMYSGYSDPVCATTPAAPAIAAPSGTEAVAQGSWAVQVRWTDNSPDEDGFFIERAPAALGPWTAANTAPANATRQNQSVNPETYACFRVVAFITLGTRRSLPSAPACTAPPAGPTNLTAAAVGHAINLAWNDNSEFEDGYEVLRYRDGVATVVATLPANSTSTINYLDNGVSVDLRYGYQVRVLKDGAYGDYSNFMTAVAPTTRPTAPTYVQAYSYFDDYYWEYYFVIAWNPGSENEEGFRINVPDGAGGWTPYAAAEAGASYWLEAYNYQSGCYQVVAWNAFGEASTEVCVEP